MSPAVLTHPTTPSLAPAKMEAHNLNLYYDNHQALFDLDMKIAAGSITAFIGPSGCGKSSFLRCLNRMNDYVSSARVAGTCLLDGQNIYGTETDVIELRRKVGMVFQKPNPFPMSIYDNVAYGPRLHGKPNRLELDEVVETSLRGAALWDEVKDVLRRSALSLSGGQQQRLCIARAIATNPEVLLMDEPTSALDPLATQRIEELCNSLREKYTVVIVTHNMQQAARISDTTAFFLMGELVEYGPTTQLFTSPVDSRTGDYITGRFG